MTLPLLSTFLTLLSVTSAMGRWWGGGQDGVQHGDRAERREYLSEGDAYDDSGVRDINGRALIIEVAKQVLRLLHQHRQQENRLGREAEAAMTSSIARDSVRLVVMGFMVYHVTITPTISPHHLTTTTRLPQRGAVSGAGGV
ncbi:hypothetical protein E2C01_063833 [Portunus trituberculatus]|uniref:Uncharacterized protein n=1 Tax=Portunus trituberculatus TaxID=210409 RepID=A0A5B7HHG6_PORTR|nr:hypothetical protein [Portunus trituberculatus]